MLNQFLFKLGRTTFFKFAFPLGIALPFDVFGNLSGLMLVHAENEGVQLFLIERRRDHAIIDFCGFVGLVAHTPEYSF